MLARMRAFAVLLLCAAAAHGATERGASSLSFPRETPEKKIPARARLVMDALWPAVDAARRAWPGYDVLARPLLVSFADGSALLVEHPAPPPEFRRVVYRGMTAYVADRGPTLLFGISLAYEYSGVRVAAVREDPPRPADDLILYVVHEAFHRHQNGFDFTPDFRNYSVDDGEDVALATLENRALAAWLEGGGPAALLDFAALRRRRRTLFPASADEISEENLEGTAEYVGTAAKEAVEGAEAAREALLAALRPPVAAKDMIKWRLYGAGAVLGRVLESRAPGAWQAMVEEGRSMSGLVLAGLPMSDAAAAARAARLASGPDYERLLAAARRDTEIRKSNRRDSRLRYAAQPGRRVELQAGELDRGFKDDGDWFVYADGKRLHEHVIEWIGDGKAGRFRLADMPVLESYRGGGRVLEFITEADILVDGRPWERGRDAAFRSLTIRGRGVDATLNAGRVERRGEVLVIVPAGAD